RSNSEKVEIYLRRCATDPFISKSSLFRDFLSAQRDEDRVAPLALVHTLVHQHQQQQQHNASLLHDSILPDVGRLDISTQDDVEGDNSGDEEILNTSSVDFIGGDSRNRISIQDFQFIKVLGKGCMGKVLLVRHQRTNQLLALKAIRKQVVFEQDEVIHTRMERDILTTIAKIQHPFLIKLHHAFQDANQLFLVLDYYVGGDMANQLAKFQRFTPERSRLYTAEILLGLQELHRLGILYRDLKPENILLAADGHIILTDFGLSKQFGPGTNLDDQRTATFCGTAEYLAPEILQEKAYTYAVDFWSLGTILYEMLMGLPPFWAETHAEMYRRILDDPLEFPEDTDPVTADFITGLLQQDPSKRLGTGINGPITIRSHPYFDCLEWTDVYYRRIKPPYVPQLQSETDFSHFDQDFLAMTPRLSPSTMQHNSNSSQFNNVDPSLLDLAFQGYSYTNTDSNYMEESFPMAASTAPSATTSDIQQSSIYYYNDNDYDDDYDDECGNQDQHIVHQARHYLQSTPTDEDSTEKNNRVTSSGSRLSSDILDGFYSDSSSGALPDNIYGNRLHHLSRQ
ncbi:kinase-like domain-containing protein, partial [Halteromyces radiatus]|uniref:kinase-like domain-containing protein n=1 Tax=Halteromyces radiatus TaxID=101107 RepID=UPI0022203D46